MRQNVFGALECKEPGEPVLCATSVIFQVDKTISGSLYEPHRQEGKERMETQRISNRKSCLAAIAANQDLQFCLWR